jgi:hypothetical protein
MAIRSWRPLRGCFSLSNWCGRYGLLRRSARARERFVKIFLERCAGLNNGHGRRRVQHTVTPHEFLCARGNITAPHFRAEFAAVHESRHWRVLKRRSLVLRGRGCDHCDAIQSDKQEYPFLKHAFPQFVVSRRKDLAPEFGRHGALCFGATKRRSMSA